HGPRQGLPPRGRLGPRRRTARPPPDAAHPQCREPGARSRGPPMTPPPPYADGAQYSAPKGSLPRGRRGLRTVTTEPPAPYVVRFRRLRPILMIAVGVLGLAISVRMIAGVVRTGQPNRVPTRLGLAVASVVLAAVGGARLARGRRTGWIAFAVDADGI